MTIAALSAPALRVTGLRLRYGDAPAVLEMPALELEGGGRLAVTGPSGSGKTSLVHLLTGIEQPSDGAVRWGDVEISALGGPQRDRFRRERIGLVFQNFHLAPMLSALENVLLPHRFAHWGAPDALRAEARAKLRAVGAPDPDRRAGLLSRGEQQRVALVRALLRRPSILVADEPTASLDPANAAAVGALLEEGAATLGATLVVVSHDPALLARFPRVLRLAGGREDRADAAKPGA